MNVKELLYDAYPLEEESDQERSERLVINEFVWWAILCSMQDMVKFDAVTFLLWLITHARVHCASQKCC
jgi:hypothetical protein